MIRNDQFLPLADYLAKTAEKYGNEPDDKDNLSAYMLLIGSVATLRWLADAPSDHDTQEIFDALNGAMERIRSVDN